MMNENNALPTGRGSLIYKSESGLFPHEILALSCCLKYPIGTSKYQSFWWYRYGVLNVGSLLESLYERGYICLADTATMLNLKSVDDLKSILKVKKQKTSGKKTELVTRVYENYTEKEINDAFPDKYYMLTPKGEKELKTNHYVIEFHKKPVDRVSLWDANRLYYENQGKPFDVLIAEYGEQIRDTNTIYSSDFYIKNITDILEFYLLSSQFNLAIETIAFEIYQELNAIRYPQNEVFFKSGEANKLFSFDTLDYKLNGKIVDFLKKIQELNGWTSYELEQSLLDALDKRELKKELFTKDECIKIAIFYIENNQSEIQKIYREAKKNSILVYPELDNTEINGNGNRLHGSDENSDNSTKEKAVMIENTLLDSFSILKDDVKKNHEQIAKIFAKLQDIQPETVIELWRYLLEKNWDNVVKDSEPYYTVSHYLTDEIMQAITYEKGFLVFEDYFVNDNKIIQAVYEYSPNLPPWTTSVVATQIKKGHFEQAGSMLEYMFANRKNPFIKQEDSICDYSFSAIFKDWIEGYLTTSKKYCGSSGYQIHLKPVDGAFQFLQYWVEQIEDPEEKARTTVHLMELL